MSPGLGYRARGSVAMFALPGRVEPSSILAVRSRSERALDTGSRVIAIDLRVMHHIDAQTLTELGAALHKISRHKATLVVVGADQRVRWVLELCDIDGLAFQPTMRHALAEVRQSERSTRHPVWRAALRRQRPAVKAPSARS